MSRAAAPAAVRWTAYAAVAVVFAIACGFLSNWQFTRNAERSEQLALVEANYDAAPMALDDLIPPGSTLTPADQWQPVEVSGRYLNDQQLLVRNRAHGGTAAFEVLVPFQLDDGRVLLIDRGWVAPGEQQRAPDAIPGAPDGQVTVIARVRPGEQLPSSGRSADDGQVPSINLPLIADVIEPAAGERLEQSAFGILVSEDPAPTARPTALESPSEDPGPHLSYAIQWILFAIMGFVFIGYIIRTELKYRREDREDALERDEAGPPPPSSDDVPRSLRRPPRPRDRDMSDEDAILDNAGR
ncbi:SURF1 family cytochrome oxidase biogenesis protein [Microbacterium pygmaeum]|uniref:SURF1-like protein n=1 Tax=Microbacterium pygmaeum TaxID=370764 RepID=A0A1G8BAG5_9MICO|nr:SURF1 family protein [Microbacterium pygmaeum]SDH30023.1 Cytochrome oxidase assembly protein ShyY1 [Microbacterium pygmaeum]